MASARPLLPAEVGAPPVAGQEGGVARGPSSSWEGAGKGRGPQRMYGSACLPGGGAASPALPQTAPLQVDRELGCRHPGRPWEVMGRGTVQISVELRDSLGQCRYGSLNPLPSVNSAPNSHRLTDA